MVSVRKLVFVIGAIVAVLAIAQPSSASPINPGQTISPVPSGGACACGGPFLADTGVQSWSVSGILHGFYRSVVFDSDPGAGVALEFWYQVVVDGQSDATASRLFMSSFAGWTTDVYYVDPGGGGAAGRFPVSADRDASGATVGFNFDPFIGPNTSTQVMVIRTNASNFTDGLLGIVGNGGSTSVHAYQPAASSPVPEPASFLLLGTGAIALRRRFVRR